MSVQLDQSPRLVPEAAQAVFVMRFTVLAPWRDRVTHTNYQFGGQELLDRNEVAHFVVTGAIYDAEATLSQNRFNRVVAKDCSLR